MEHQPFKPLWMDGVELPRFPRLKNETNTDVLIVGGGLAGALCAFLLHEAGVSHILCEAAAIGSGTTGGTTAVISAQHDILYADLIKQRGEANARRYLRANLEAVEAYRALASRFDFDFEDAPAHLYSRDDRARMEEEARAVNRLGFGAEFTDESPLPFPIAGAVRFPHQAQMHPRKLLAHIAPGLDIYEHTKIDKIDEGIAYAGEIAIRAKRIIVATHFPIVNRRGLYPIKLHQERSYVLALKGAEAVDGSYSDIASDGFYFRDYHDLLLLGGGDHRTGMRGGGFEALRIFAREHYPSAQEAYAWATQDCMSLDGVPYIGAYSPNLPNVYVATGFNEWGMTSSMVAANILRDAVLGRENPYAAVFAPNRSILRAQLLANLGVSTISLLSPTLKRCPHMGCALQWNPVERTWDCPCHGSRFGEDGKLLYNPSTEDLG